jgi:hypothetical protein
MVGRSPRRVVEETTHPAVSVATGYIFPADLHGTRSRHRRAASSANGRHLPRGGDAMERRGCSGWPCSGGVARALEAVEDEIEPEHELVTVVVAGL